jgi:predicted nucleotidyltransferase component of viral defense system
VNGITPGRLARHTPAGPQRRYAALIDIAQDLLLAHLHDQGVFEHLVFKGGTALRKLYAGNAGRFSTDLDFSVREPSRHQVLGVVADRSVLRPDQAPALQLTQDCPVQGEEAGIAER